MKNTQMRNRNVSVCNRPYRTRGGLLCNHETSYKCSINQVSRKFEANLLAERHSRQVSSRDDETPYKVIYTQDVATQSLSFSPDGLFYLTAVYVISSINTHTHAHTSIWGLDSGNSLFYINKNSLDFLLGLSPSTYMTKRRCFAKNRSFRLKAATLYVCVYTILKFFSILCCFVYLLFFFNFTFSILIF